MKKTNSIFLHLLALLLILTLLLSSSGIAFSAEHVGSGKAGIPEIDFTASFVPDEVLATADSWQHAYSIAEAYELELKSYAYGIAVMATPDAKAAVAQSISAQNIPENREKPLPQLGLNRIYHTYEIANNEQISKVARATTNADIITVPNDLFIIDAKKTKETNQLFSLHENIPSPSTLNSQLSTLNSLPSTWTTQQTINNYPDPGQQWHRIEMDMERAWLLSKGSNTVVAVIDTGLDIDHPAFAGRISAKSYNTYTDMIGPEHTRDGYGHGTHVSGIIAASLNRTTDVCGVAPEVELLVIKANFGDSGWFLSEDLYRAINYAAQNGADIINMSLGRNYADGWGADEMEQSVIAQAVARGVTVVCAAGNDLNNHAGFPAAYPECIAVSATVRGYMFENNYSNFGPEIGLAAPGTDIHSTMMGNNYGNMSGTSMAAPCVAGTAALIHSLHPDYSPQQIRRTLYETARDAGEVGYDEYYGNGIVNAYAASLGSNALYSVTYDFNDSLRSPIVVRTIPGHTLLEPDNPQRTGYAFEGWYIGGSNFEYNFALAPTNNLRLEAHWSEARAGMYIVEFPDANFRRAVLQLLKNSYGVIRKESSYVANDLYTLSSVNYLSIANLRIHDLTGLRYFGGLQDLWCPSNFLNELDVSMLTALKYLSCFNNSLTKLNIANNNTLESVICYGNRLSELNTTNCRRLRELYCGNNQLVTLDVSDNLALEYLICYDNQLSMLNVSKNTALRDLECGNNPLGALDVSKNKELSYLMCYENQLKTLDISYNPALTALNCVTNNLTL
ncbi:MAG: S8 family serine peptidase, partial [Clostridiales bacterium]|nr:S8 family serine peptidase [Clostridiales bacterium]